MGLTGVDPQSPLPAIRREYAFGTGASIGQSDERKVLLVGNRTATGTETLDTVPLTPIRDEIDARLRLGQRSEAYWMWKCFSQVPQTCNVFVLTPTASAGTASSCPFTVTNASTANGTYEFTCIGFKFEVPVAEGEGTQTVAERAAAYFNAAENGTLPATAATSDPGGGPWTMTITASHAGPRSSDIIGSTATIGIRVRYIGPTNAQTFVKTTGGFVAGATDDDWTDAITAASATEFFYHALAKTTTSAPTATDNGLGEYLTMIKTQHQPSIGKDQIVFYATRGTNAQAITVATDAQVNCAFAHGIWSENNDWTAPMMAAHVCAIARSEQIAHPSANINGRRPTDSKIMNIPAPYSQGDWPTSAELVSALNNGVTPISVEGTTPTICRFITTRSLNDQGGQDYRCREGHIPSAVFFAWNDFRTSFEGIRQPFADAEPAEGVVPAARTMVPSTIKSMVQGRIEDLCSSTPLGRYFGPILKPSAKQEMLDNLSVTYAAGGSFPTSIDLKAVEHFIKLEALVRETGASY